MAACVFRFAVVYYLGGPSSGFLAASESLTLRTCCVRAHVTDYSCGREGMSW